MLYGSLNVFLSFQDVFFIVSHSQLSISVCKEIKNFRMHHPVKAEI